MQDVIGEMYCPGENCLNREKCESLGVYVTTPRSFHVCGKCRAWLFVYKVTFMLQEHVKMTKTDRTHFFFAKKPNLLPDNYSLRSLLGTFPHQSQSPAPKKVKLSPKME